MGLVGAFCDVSSNGGYVYIEGKGVRGMKQRPKVRWFAKKMEGELRKNESKGGWEWEDYDYLLDRAKANLKEIKLRKLWGLDTNSIEVNYAIKCCVDCANFCMMLADNIRGN